MPSKTELILGRVLEFPSALPQTDVTAEDREVAEAHWQHVGRIVQDVSSALQELRHVVEITLFDSLEKLDLDAGTLVKLLDERPSVVDGLLTNEASELSMERLLQILELVRPQS